MALRDKMTEALEGWQAAIPAPWQEVLDGAGPDLRTGSLDIPDDRLRDPIYPPLLGHEEGPGLFRPFREIPPDQVRVVVIGQDPYPEAPRATGRAFEDYATEQLGMSRSLKRLLQVGFSSMEPGLNADRHDDGWELIEGRVTELLPDRGAMTSYFDRLAREDGVLFVNAAWTFTAPAPALAGNELKSWKSKIQNGHRAAWRPVMLNLIAALAGRDQPTAFLLLGAAAQDLMDTSKLILRQSAIVRGKHPAARGVYFDAGFVNPLQQINECLSELGEAEIDWRPGARDHGAG